MPIRNAHWYGQNEGRSYPLDDKATARADNGVRLPPDIITDLNLRWPNTFGNYAFIAAIANTPNIVTLTIQAADAADSVDGFAPLAVISVVKPVTLGRMYAVQGYVAGIGGWIVFGNGTTGETYHGRFSSPVQSLLTARAARAYAPLPVSSLQASNASVKLTGMVTLKATEPLEIVKEERPIAGVSRDCIVIRLIDDTSTDGFTLSADVDNVSRVQTKSTFELFAGPCAGRPESSTCGCPEPIEYINSVAPNCDGVLTVEFQGCAQVASLPEDTGLALTCDFVLGDACVEPHLPNSDGVLPYEVDPAFIPDPDDEPEPPIDGGGDSDSFIDNGALPYQICFLDGISPLTDVLGLWRYDEDNSPTEICGTFFGSSSDSIMSSDGPAEDGSWQSNTAAQRNVSILNADQTTVYRQAVTEAKLLNTVGGASHNAQLIINYREHATIDGQFVYFAAEINYDTQEFRLLRFNGSTFNTVASVSVIGIQLNKWYRITVTCVPFGTSGAVTLTVRLEALEGTTDVSFSANVSNYQPSNGKFGVGTNMAISRFGYLTVDEAP